MIVMKKCLYLLVVVLTLFSCGEDETGRVAPPDAVTEPPYDNPIWHPSGEIIGFNHTPISEIHADNGRQYYWSFDRDLRGFWLINADGSNMRQVLPYYLNTPSWSPDGKWIAFSNDAAQICIMPFDGEKFDATAIQVITDKGRNFFPAWSYDGEKILFTQSICNEDLACGVWGHSFETKKIEFIIRGTDPTWSLQSDYFFYIENVSVEGKVLGDNILIYDFKDKSSALVVDLSSPNIDNRYLQYSPDGKFIAFISIMNNGEGTQLFKITSDGSGLTKLTSDGCTQFSWSPDSKKIIYVNFYETYIDETTGSLWTMDVDGSNKKPLTYNSFKIVQ